MKKKKLLILGLDALEYTIIEENNFENLKQANYGKIEINLPRLFSPEIWSSFITGKKPSEHKVKAWHHSLFSKISELGTVSRIKEKFGFLSIPIEKMEHLLRDILSKISYPETRIENLIKGKTEIDTFLKYSENPILIFDPFKEGQITGPRYKKVGESLLRAIKKSKEQRKFERKMWKLYKKKKKMVLDRIHKDWDLLMLYVYITDAFQHIFWDDEEKIMKIYEDLDLFVSELKKKLPEETRILIVSDHGQKKGIHTPYGFYSYNKSLNNWIKNNNDTLTVDFENPKITDFFELAKAILSPKKFQEERIENHLKELGYA